MILIKCDICLATIETISHDIEKTRIGGELPITSYCDPCKPLVEKIQEKMKTRTSDAERWFQQELDKLKERRRGG
ncbi:hypothetical protein LCGC14_1183630 [marine sediment metagenome]|uniref:Uncharacterized protein n=1 Tax=marine sediment metagenome TaxID=412755 RepID=A0A0F9M972_9ZZZZ